MTSLVRLSVTCLVVGVVACGFDRHVTLDLRSQDASSQNQGGQGEPAPPPTGGANPDTGSAGSPSTGGVDAFPTGGRASGGTELATGGATATSGGAGAEAGGGTSAETGGGTGAETGAGTGGESSVPCVETCSDDTPICDPTSGACVECVNDADCDGDRCGPSQTCVECLVDQDCETGKVCDLLALECMTPCTSSATCLGDTSLCHPLRFLCVECIQDADCDEERCHPAKAECVECISDADCDGETCDLERGQCGGDSGPDNDSEE